MNVLVLHSLYTSGTTSGENRVVQDEIDLLRSSEHLVEAWTPEPGFGAGEVLRAGKSAVWSTRAAQMVRDLLRTRSIDIVHCHNLFPMLSPLVIRVAEREGVPVVMTLHNFRMMCLAGTFLRDGEICEDCLGKVPWRGAVHGCYRSSRVAGSVLATSLTLHRSLDSYSGVACFLAVSEFVARKHVAAGISPLRIRIKSNFTWPAERRSGPGTYFLYLGRLSAEKGIDRLARSWDPSWGELRIVGEGPLEEKIRGAAGPGVRMSPSVPGNEAHKLIGGARAVMVPSVCYEGAPRVVLEAYAAGVPVIASRIGGLPEIVEDNRTGFLAGVDGEGWRAAIETLLADRTSLAMGESARALWDKKFSPEVALEELVDAYESTLSGHALSRSPEGMPRAPAPGPSSPRAG